MESLQLMVVTAVFLSTLLHSGVSLHCYQCDSTLDSACQENWDHSLEVNQLKYKECQLWDAKYCSKVTGMWGGVVGTHRFCTSKNLGDQCQDIWFLGHDRMYRACSYSCDSDGCNKAGSLLPLSSVLISGLSALVLAVVRFL